MDLHVLAHVGPLGDVGLGEEEEDVQQVGGDGHVADGELVPQDPLPVWGEGQGCRVRVTELRYAVLELVYQTIGAPG